jgi:hypothetical protein
VKAITICQPHAWAVIHGSKLFENRTWKSDYRGPLLIHAGQSSKWLDDCDMYPGCPAPMDGRMVFGAIIGVVMMRGSKLPGLEDARYFGFGPWCHVYTEARPVPHPVECRGKQGLWTPPEKVVAEVRRQLLDLAVAS